MVMKTMEFDKYTGNKWGFGDMNLNQCLIPDEKYVLYIGGSLLSSCEAEWNASLVYWRNVHWMLNQSDVTCISFLFYMFRILIRCYKWCTVRRTTYFKYSMLEYLQGWMLADMFAGLKSLQMSAGLKYQQMFLDRSVSRHVCWTEVPADVCFLKCEKTSVCGIKCQ
jgi:hypothetical protein